MAIRPQGDCIGMGRIARWDIWLSPHIGERVESYLEEKEVQKPTEVPGQAQFQYPAQMTLSALVSHSHRKGHRIFQGKHSKSCPGLMMVLRLKAETSQQGISDLHSGVVRIRQQHWAVSPGLFYWLCDLTPPSVVLWASDSSSINQ